MQTLATQLLHKFAPETAHTLAVNLLRCMPVTNTLAGLDLSAFSQNLFGLQFPHPLGLAAGFDKHAQVFHQLGRLGFACVEVGSITPRPQPGNPKPRVFRLPAQKAIINRYGFNSRGLTYACKKLQQLPRTCVTGINLGVNKTTTRALDDFLLGATRLLDQADYFTINISSPNTPGLRDLQTPTALRPIITQLRQVLAQSARRIPLFIKLAPDMPLAQETALLEFLTEIAVDGIIICNTTVSRTNLITQPHDNETGGLSGPPLRECATAMLRRAYRITRGKVLLIGSGGISSGQDAYEKLCAGANLLQLYTAFIYAGPAVIRTVLLELNAILARQGVKHISEIIGSTQ